MTPSPKYDHIAGRIAEFICGQVGDTGARGVVFGLSGGIDSAVTAALCVRALGKEKCTAVIMPHGQITPDSETADGLALAAQLGIGHHTCNIEPIVSSFQQAADISGGKVPTGNLLARVRASMLYYYANTLDCLVVGTDDKSEYLIGYFTKYGDGASDILPIRDLYKTQVQELGRFLGVPDNIVDKQPGAHLWKDHNARGEIGVGYDVIDKILVDWLENKAGPDQIAASHKIAPDMVKKIMGLHAGSEHKRQLQPFCDIGGGE